VRERPCLWDKFHKDYMNKNIKTNNWKDVSKEMITFIGDHSFDGNTYTN